MGNGIRIKVLFAARALNRSSTPNSNAVRPIGSLIVMLYHLHGVGLIIKYWQH